MLDQFDKCFASFFIWYTATNVWHSWSSLRCASLTILVMYFNLVSLNNHNVAYNIMLCVIGALTGWIVQVLSYGVGIKPNVTKEEFRPRYLVTAHIFCAGCLCGVMWLLRALIECDYQSAEITRQHLASAVGCLALSVPVLVKIVGNDLKFEIESIWQFVIACIPICFLSWSPVDDIPNDLTNCAVIMLMFFCSTAAAVVSPGEIGVEQVLNHNSHEFNTINRMSTVGRWFVFQTIPSIALYWVTQQAKTHRKSLHQLTVQLILACACIVSYYGFLAYVANQRTVVPIKNK